MSRIKLFAFLHGEKFVLGLVGLLTLLITYESLNLPRLDDKYQADALQREITLAENEIERFTWDKALSDYPDKVRKVKTITLKGDFKVDSRAYVNNGGPNGKMLVSFDTAVVAPMVLRTDPKILNALDVYVTGGTGMLAFNDDEIHQRRQFELAIKEEEKAMKELQSKQKEQIAAAGRGRGRWEGPGADPSIQPYDPDHPKRRPIGASLRIGGVTLQGDERIERAYWACVVALVPVREQLKLYEESFEKARGFDIAHDFPQYLGFFVERAEVLPGKKLEWRRVPLYDGQQKSIATKSTLSNAPLHAISLSVIDELYAAATQFWPGGGSTDAVDERYLQRALTLPLPPLVGRDWSFDATHPKIGLGPPALEEDAEQLMISTTEPQQSAIASGFGKPGPRMQSAPSATRTGRIPEPSGSTRYARGTMGPIGISPEGYSPGPRRYWGGSGEGRGSYRGPASRTEVTDTILPWGVDCYLLRFFDFTVEPGKAYKYRVKLAITDPNYDVPINTLAPKVLDRQAQAAKANNGWKPVYRVAEEWSDPSPIVGIPFGGRIRLAGVKVPPADTFNEEPSVSLLITASAVDENGNAIQAGIEEKDFRRGYVANLVNDTEYVGPGYIDTQENFQFFTGVTLLDIDGGTKLTREICAPSRILLMGPAGQLYIHNELDDKPFVEYHRLLFEKPDPKNRGPGGRIARRSE
jgi:hypothetical protein